MNLFLLFSILITLAAAFSYVNLKAFRLPTGIALMLMGALVAGSLILISQFSPRLALLVKEQLSGFNFSEFILGILLSFLLFAGSLHVSYDRLKDSALSIITFSTLGVIISTFLTGFAACWIIGLFGISIPFIYCLLFGALISPTDPIAVLSILKKAGIPPDVEIKITGESLFNDGVGVVVFLSIAETISGSSGGFSVSSALLLFTQQAIGGMLAGLVIGFIGYRLMRSIDHFQTEILISLAMVMGGYSLCHYLHISGPLAMVVAGIFTGHKSLGEAVSDSTRDHLEKFWEVLDEILNAMLFLLIGLEMITISFHFQPIIIGFVLAVVIILVRFVSLWLPAQLFRFRKQLGSGTLGIMTWGGLRGGLSIAMALELPDGEYKDLIVSVTFIIVGFSIFVQGLTIERVVNLIRKK